MDSGKHATRNSNSKTGPKRSLQTTNEWSSQNPIDTGFDESRLTTSARSPSSLGSQRVSLNRDDATETKADISDISDINPYEEEEEESMQPLHIPTADTVFLSLHQTLNKAYSRLNGDSDSRLCLYKSLVSSFINGIVNIVESAPEDFTQIPDVLMTEITNQMNCTLKQVVNEAIQIVEHPIDLRSVANASSNSVVRDTLLDASRSPTQLHNIAHSINLNKASHKQLSGKDTKFLEKHANDYRKKHAETNMKVAKRYNGIPCGELIKATAPIFVDLCMLKASPLSPYVSVTFDPVMFDDLTYTNLISEVPLTKDANTTVTLCDKSPTVFDRTLLLNIASVQAGMSVTGTTGAKIGTVKSSLRTHYLYHIRIYNSDHQYVVSKIGYSNNVTISERLRGYVTTHMNKSPTADGYIEVVSLTRINKSGDENAWKTNTLPVLHYNSIRHVVHGTGEVIDPINNSDKDEYFYDDEDGRPVTQTFTTFCNTNEFTTHNVSMFVCAKSVCYTDITDKSTQISYKNMIDNMLALF